MAQPVVSVEEVGKQYRLRDSSRADTVRDALVAGIRSLGRRLHSEASARRRENRFWALRGISFQVERGEVLGILGRNGAGKSTLLKIISSITEPTAGRVRIRGRVASLLEVGTGFHPELSGRDNIFLNGAILGMKRTEIRRKFDEIVAFAGVERFLDMSVKHYSSGMYVRLAFAVAAHLEPEILIVDEVLAVGDVAFQKKCLGKMRAVASGEGRTVIYVSHNLPSIRQLCSRAILLADGAIAAAGPCAAVLETYEHGLAGGAPAAVPPPGPEAREQAYATAVRVEDLAGRPLATVPVGAPWRVVVAFRVVAAQRGFCAGIGVRAADGLSVQSAWIPPRDLPAGDYRAVFVQDRVVLEAGSYTILVGFTQNDRSLQQFEAARLDVTGDGAVGYYPGTSGFGAVLNSMTTALEPA